MEALLDFSHASGIYAFMHSAWGWPIVESLHFIGLSLLVGTVGLFDLRMVGLAKGIPMSALHKLVPWGTVASLHVPQVERIGFLDLNETNRVAVEAGADTLIDTLRRS